LYAGISRKPNQPLRHFFLIGLAIHIARRYPNACRVWGTIRWRAIGTA
jgi:hypothetical protein